MKDIEIALAANQLKHRIAETWSLEQTTDAHESIEEGGRDGYVLIEDEASLLAWKSNVEHLAAQKSGKAKWYSQYKIRIAKVERDYSDKESNLD